MQRRRGESVRPKMVDTTSDSEILSRGSKSRAVGQQILSSLVGSASVFSLEVHPSEIGTFQAISEIFPDFCDPSCPSYQPRIFGVGEDDVEYQERVLRNFILDSLDVGHPYLKVRNKKKTFY